MLAKISERDQVSRQIRTVGFIFTDFHDCTIKRVPGCFPRSAAAFRHGTVLWQGSAFIFTDFHSLGEGSLLLQDQAHKMVFSELCISAWQCGCVSWQDQARMMVVPELSIAQHGSGIVCLGRLWI